MPEITIHLLKITGPEGFHVEHELREGALIMGRQPPEGITLPNARVSRSHAQIARSGEHCEVMDLGSSNGTLLNGESLPQRIPFPLVDGDAVLIDPFEIVYSIVQRSAAAAPHKPKEPQKKAEPKPEIETSDDKTGIEKSRPKKPVASSPPAVKEAVTPPSKPTEAAKKPSDSVDKPSPIPAPKGRSGSEGVVPPSPPADVPTPKEPDEIVPPGLTIYSEKFVNYLPGIYHTDFMKRFLGIFEGIFVPIEWTVGNFDMFLSPGTAPEEFLNWLAGWYDIIFDSTWSESQRRAFLKESPQIFARRGTSWSLKRIIEIYSGLSPDIIDTGSNIEPHTFLVRMRQSRAAEELIRALIEANKPAHTAYQLEIVK